MNAGNGFETCAFLLIIVSVICSQYLHLSNLDNWIDWSRYISVSVFTPVLFWVGNIIRYLLLTILIKFAPDASETLK